MVVIIILSCWEQHSNNAIHKLEIREKFEWILTCVMCIEDKKFLFDD